MPFKKHGRKYDLVVLGATGYTGQLVAEFITSSFPTHLKWAIAGRSETKLRAVIDECKRLNPDRPLPDIETSDVDDDERLSALAKNAFLLITTVGPYCQYGEGVIKACAQSGTHYLDLTGEVFWVHRMIKKYENTAKASGAILVPQLGVESSPADLCTWALAGCLRKRLGAKTGDVTISLHKIRSRPSGGTLATILASLDHFTLQEIKASHQPYALSPVPHPAEPQRPPMSIWHLVFGVRHVRNLGILTTAFNGSTDRGEVERSWGLLSQIPSRKDEFYGPNFHWAEYQKVRNWLHGVAMHWIVILATMLLVLLPPLRALLKRFVSAPGTGPSKHETTADEVEFRGVANPDTEGSGKQAFCRAWFHGSLYYLSAIFASQAALTILEDNLELEGGFYTPCCLGQAFVDRVRDAGFKLEVKIQDQ